MWLKKDRFFARDTIKSSTYANIGAAIEGYGESRYGLNHKDGSDHSADPDRDGYTNIEEYLNSTDPNVFVDYTKSENNVGDPGAGR